MQKSFPRNANLALARAQLALKQQRVEVAEAPAFTRWLKDENVTLEDPHKPGNAVLRFNPWATQLDYLSLIHRARQTITLKARQLGFSWCVIIYCLWLCIFHESVAVYVLSKDLDAAKEVIRRARGVFKRLTNCPVREKGRGDNQQEIKFSNGSRFKAFPATKNAATSFTATFLIVDEADKMEYGKELYTSIKPLIDDGGRIAIIFTAFGSDGLGRAIWQKAGTEVDGASIIKFFAPWWSRPGRDQNWYNRVATEAISLAHHRQEYPATPEEALNFTNLDERFIRDIAMWQALKVDALHPALPCVLALDAGITSDNFACASAVWHPQKRIPVIRDTMHWEPEKTETKQLDLGEAYDWIRRYIKSHRVRRVVYDPYQMVAFGQELQKLVDAREFGQGAERMGADTTFKQRISRAEIGHHGQEALELHVGNANLKLDSSGQRIRMIKRSEDHKIDLAVTASMAAYELVTEFPFGSDNAGMMVSNGGQTQGETGFVGNSLPLRAFSGMPQLIRDRFGR